MNKKVELYEKHIKPKVAELIELAEQYGVNIAIVAHAEDAESDIASVLGATYFDPEKNGISPHILAVDRVAKMEPEFAMAVFETARKDELEREAAANPHGVAE